MSSSSRCSQTTSSSSGIPPRGNHPSKSLKIVVRDGRSKGSAWRRCWPRLRRGLGGVESGKPGETGVLSEFRVVRGLDLLGVEVPLPGIGPTVEGPEEDSPANSMIEAETRGLICASAVCLWLASVLPRLLPFFDDDPAAAEVELTTTAVTATDTSLPILTLLPDRREGGLTADVSAAPKTSASKCLSMTATTDVGESPRGGPELVRLMATARAETESIAGGARAGDGGAGLGVPGVDGAEDASLAVPAFAALRLPRRLLEEVEVDGPGVVGDASSDGPPSAPESSLVPDPPPADEAETALPFLRPFRAGEDGAESGAISDPEAVVRRAYAMVGKSHQMSSICRSAQPIYQKHVRNGIILSYESLERSIAGICDDQRITPIELPRSERHAGESNCA